MKNLKTEGAHLLREEINKLRSALQMKKKDIAESVGVDRTTFSHWLSDRRRPTIEQALVIKRVLNIPLESWARSNNKAT